MLENVETAQANYVEEKDTNIEIDTGGVKDEPSALIFKAGQSKRIWNELYKVTAPISHFMHSAVFDVQLFYHKGGFNFYYSNSKVWHVKQVYVM